MVGPRLARQQRLIGAYNFWMLIRPNLGSTNPARGQRWIFRHHSIPTTTRIPQRLGPASPFVHCSARTGIVSSLQSKLLNNSSSCADLAHPLRLGLFLPLLHNVAIPCSEPDEASSIGGQNQCCAVATPRMLLDAASLRSLLRTATCLPVPPRPHQPNLHNDSSKAAWTHRSPQGRRRVRDNLLTNTSRALLTSVSN